MLKIFNYYITITDFISEKPQLLLNKSVRSKTIYGGILSIASICLILYALIAFSLDLLSRKTSTLNYNKTPVTSGSYEYGKFPFMVALLDNGLKLIEEEDRYYYFLADIWAFSPDNSTGSIVMKLKRTTITTEKCDINKHFGEYKDYFKDVPYLPHHYCMVPGQNITLYGIYGSIEPYNFLDFWISTCVNDTLANRTDCYSRTQSQARLSNTYISYQSLEYFIDHTNIPNPGQLMLRSEILPVSSTIYKRDFFYMRNINYYTDLDFIFSNSGLQIYNQVSNFREAADLRPQGTVPGSFALLSIIMDNSADEYKRRFTKFQELLANLGGLFKGIWVIAYFVNYLFFDELYYLNLISGSFRSDYIDAPGVKNTNTILKDLTIKDKKNNNDNQNDNNNNVKNATSIMKELNIDLTIKDKKNNNDNVIINNSSNNMLKLTNYPKFQQINSVNNIRYVNNSNVKNNSIKKYDTLDNLNFLDLICVKCISKKQSSSNKIRIYKLAKQYTEDNLCIKNILNKLSEINKLKCFIFNLEQISIFNSVPTPSLSSIENGTENIWENFIFKNLDKRNTDVLLANLKSKMNKNHIDNNIINIIEVYDS